MYLTFIFTLIIIMIVLDKYHKGKIVEITGQQEDFNNY